jgi:nuclear-control-of-ATPase protein 2
MPSTFAQNHTRGLNSVSDSTVLHFRTDKPSVASQNFQTLLLSLKSTSSLSQINDIVDSLCDVEKSASGSDPEESALEGALLDKLVIAIYAEALDIYLAEAIQVESEAEWWADIERSRLSVAYYLLQSKSDLGLVGERRQGLPILVETDPDKPFQLYLQGWLMQ